MKKIYKIITDYQANITTGEEIKNHYSDYNTEYYSFININDDSEVLFKSAEEALAYGLTSYDATSLTILEYELSEDNMLDLILCGEIKISPNINHKFIVWDDSEQKMKEFTSIAFV